MLKDLRVEVKLSMLCMIPIQKRPLYESKHGGGGKGGTVAELKCRVLCAVEVLSLAFKATFVP